MRQKNKVYTPWSSGSCLYLTNTKYQKKIGVSRIWTGMLEHLVALLAYRTGCQPLIILTDCDAELLLLIELTAFSSKKNWYKQHSFLSL